METICKSCKHCPICNDEKESRSLKIKISDFNTIYSTMPGGYCMIFGLNPGLVKECEGYDKKGNFKIK